MGQGFSGTYAVGGVEFLLQPETGRWTQKDFLGNDGNGRAIYPAIKEFEVSWSLMHVSELQQIINAQLQVGNTGTLVFDLPKWGDAGYQFYSYSGCFVREPEVGVYFANGWIQDVRLVITNIRV